MDECIIETLSYFDIFDYPLTFSELKKFSGCEIDNSDDELYALIESIPVIQETNGYYYFLGRRSIVAKRIDRSDVSIHKIAKAKIIAKLLSFIPSIEYIGASGSLSMNNASITDDIDLFIITKERTLWLTRLAVNTILVLLRQKRGRLDKNSKDKICPNMFLEMGNLAFSTKRKTLYTAHEIVQMKTLFDRNNIYGFFLNKNKWVADFFPNFTIPVVKRKKRVFSPGQNILVPFEKIAFYIQKKYMGKYRSIEVVAPGKALFHPIDRQKIIMDMYILRFKRYWKLYSDNLWVDRDEANFYMDEKKIRILN